jgi:hypothetical protein
MSYEEVNGLLDRNLVDMAFICTGAYIDGSDNFDLLVAPLPIISLITMPTYTNENSGIEPLRISGADHLPSPTHFLLRGTYAIKRAC